MAKSHIGVIGLAVMGKKSGFEYGKQRLYRICLQPFSGADEKADRKTQRFEYRWYIYHGRICSVSSKAAPDHVDGQSRPTDG